MALIYEIGFNETSGTSLADSSGSGNNWTRGASGSFVTGHYGNGVQGSASSGNPNGAAAGATVVSAANTFPLTIMYWAKVASDNTLTFSYFNPSGRQDPLYMWVEADGSYGTFFYSSTNVVSGELASSAGAISVGTWHHFAAVFTDTSTTMFLDGVQTMSTSYSSRVFAGGTTMYAGGGRWGSSASTFDDVRIYNEVLNQTQIAAQMASSVGDSGGPTAPTVITTVLNPIVKDLAFSQTLDVIGTTPISWSVSAGTLPSGLSLNSSTGVLSGTSTASGAYDFTVQATNSEGSDTQQYTGLISDLIGSWPAAATAAVNGTGQARMMFVGDSITEGEGASTRQGRWIDVVTSTLRSTLGIAGTGLGHTPPSYNTYLAESVSWRGPATASPGTSHKDFARGSGEYFQWTISGTAFSVLWTGFVGSGSMTVSIDGGAGETITGATSGLIRRWDRTGLSAGSHTVRVTAGAGGGLINGIVAYDGDSPTVGLTYLDWSWTGGVSSAWGSGQLYDMTGMQWNPHLIVDEQFGANDYFEDLSTPAQVADRFEARVALYRSWSSNPTVVALVAPYWPSGSAHEETSVNGLGYTMDDYRDAHRTKAEELGVVVIDLRDTIGTQPSGQLVSDGLHLSATGYASWSGVIAPALAELVTGEVSQLKLGDGELSALYVGDSQVVRAYQGSARVWGDAP